jgi:pimeloyl-ACP methyl ester carboxylesterase
VCLHGLPGSARDFRWLAPALTKRGLRVVRLELPGFGRSDASRPDLDALAERVRDGLDRLRISGPLVLGHSFGGVVAMRAAARWPEAVSRLALVAAPGLRRHRALARHTWGLELAHHAHRPLVGGLLRRVLQAGFHRAGFRNDTDEARVLLTLRILRNFDFGDQASSWSRIRTPTAVVWCADDPFIEDEIAADLARRMPDGPRLRFESGGHNPQKHRALALADCLADWHAAPCLSASG